MNTPPKERLLFFGTAILGAGAIALAVRIGKPWQITEVIYDLGVALLTVALVELLILRVLHALAARRTALEQMMAELAESAERSKRQMEAIDQSMRDIKLDNVASTLRKIDEIQSIKLEEIHRAVDPRYAAAVQRATTQQTTHNPKP